ncbi:winged helix-turn-helix domain-containing protein [Kitasatospora sp. NBC_00070]|uniref:GntR family transcriptional regulator n=1 Tax=Kitasatospora sp. NBC_00070 TaxID=2975962 RepID=UPI003244AAA2
MSLVQDERPPYVQVADTLRAAIGSGEYPPGAKLPSVKKLAETFGIAEMTVHNGLRVLREEGRIVSTPGRGTFVRSDVPPVPVDAAESDVLRQVEHLASRVDQLTKRVAELERQVQAPPVPD